MTNYAYIRVSHVESLTKTSLDTQERTIKSYAKSNGFDIDYVYSEVVSGGVDFKKRKVFSIDDDLIRKHGKKFSLTKSSHMRKQCNNRLLHL